MNRRDAALIAHLDAIEARISARFDTIDRRLDTLIDAIADLRVDLTRHIADGHGGEE
jgi:hypothetical protein